jgi:hypothetical protein
MNSKRSLRTFVLIAIAVCAPGKAWATTYISDNFSTFAPGNLVGQNGWTQLGASASLPLQVSGGSVVIPGNQTVDNQDAVKAFGSTVSTTLYAGLSLNLSSAPSPPPSYFFALTESTANFANARLSAIDNSANVPGTYVLEARYTGQGGNPFVAGTTPLFYGQTYNVIEKVIVTPTGAGEGIVVYVNPTSNVEGAQTPYLDTTSQTTTGFIIPPVGFTGAIISQFAGGATRNVGVAIDHVYIADTFAEAAMVPVPEPSSILLAGFGGAIGLLVLRRRKK